MRAEECHVEIDGLRFRCRVEGADDAPWVMFSNSLLTDLSLWDEQVHDLSGRYRILRYDQRGHGDTPVPPAGPCDFERLADDAVALLDAFRVERATIIGASMGAVTALRLAASHPERIDGIVACDGPAKSPESARTAWGERFLLARTQGMPALAEATVRRWFRPETIAAGLPAVAKVRAMIVATPVDGFVASGHALLDYDLTGCLPQLAPPALLLAGADDGTLPEAMREMARAIPGATFREIANAGHLPNLERPSAFRRAIGEFLER